MSVWFLVITFYLTGTYDGSIASTTIPQPFASYKACDSTGKTVGPQYRQESQGGADVNWVCVEKTNGE